MVTGWIDLSKVYNAEQSILPPTSAVNKENNTPGEYTNTNIIKRSKNGVLNGIAYDDANDMFIVSGKEFEHLYFITRAYEMKVSQGDNGLPQSSFQYCQPKEDFMEDIPI